MIVWFLPLYYLQGVHDTILQALSFTKDVVLGKFQAAKKDNEFVYHEAVPPFENIPDIKGRDQSEKS